VTETITAFAFPAEVEPQPLTYDVVLDRVAEIVAADPLNSPACRYVNEDNSSCCIVGNLFQEQLRAYGITFNHPRNRTPIANLAPDYNIKLPTMTPKALYFLAAIQRSQDAGNPWAVALGYAAGATEGMDEHEYRTPPSFGTQFLRLSA